MRLKEGQHLYDLCLPPGPSDIVYVFPQKFQVMGPECRHLSADFVH